MGRFFTAFGIFGFNKQEDGAQHSMVSIQGTRTAKKATLFSVIEIGPPRNCLGEVATCHTDEGKTTN
jgi:hypothetical protein